MNFRGIQLHRLMTQLAKDVPLQMILRFTEAALYRRTEIRTPKSSRWSVRRVPVRNALSISIRSWSCARLCGSMGSEPITGLSQFLKWSRMVVEGLIVVVLL